VTRAFNVAYFFHTPPSVVLALPVVEFLEWERHAVRLWHTQQSPS
jgi:hypothetical protein